MYCKADFHLKYHMSDYETGNLQQKLLHRKFGNLVVYLISCAFKKEDRYGTFINNEKYDAASNKWTIESNMPTARHGLAAAGCLYW